MKNLITICAASLALSACVITPINPNNRLGVITDKQIVVTQERVENRSHGLHGLLEHALGMDERIRERRAYQYRIKVSILETLIIRSEQNFDNGACVMVYDLQTNPQLQPNPSCQPF